MSGSHRAPAEETELDMSTTRQIPTTQASTTQIRIGTTPSAPIPVGERQPVVR